MDPDSKNKITMHYNCILGLHSKRVIVFWANTFSNSSNVWIYCVFTCVSVLYACACAINMCLCIYVCMCMYICARVHVYAYACVFVCYICVHVYVCVCACACVQVTSVIISVIPCHVSSIHHSVLVE